MKRRIICPKELEIYQAAKATGKAIEQAEQNYWLLGAEVQLSERISTQVSVELLAHGLLIMGAGQNRYHISATSNANVKEYLKKAKAEM